MLGLQNGVSETSADATTKLTTTPVQNLSCARTLSSRLRQKKSVLQMVSRMGIQNIC